MFHVKQPIYLDNAATHWPKPAEVCQAIAEALELYAANPGRSGHVVARRSQSMVATARDEISSFFGLEDSSRLVFMPSATAALNQAIKGLLKPGDHVIASSIEHNSVTRPLLSMGRLGVQLSTIRCEPDGSLPLEELERVFLPNTRLVCLSHASNVTGTILPVKKAAEIAHSHGSCLLLDAAQTAGVAPVDKKELGFDLLAFPGHKGLMGPPGIAGLFVAPELDLEPLIEGGTGRDSISDTQPREYPDHLESGTLNTIGIAGLLAGLKLVKRIGIGAVEKKTSALTGQFLQGLKDIPAIRVYGPKTANCRAPVVSINLTGADPEEVAFAMDRIYAIAVRPGLHCAPWAHQTMGTAPRGTIRFSFSYFNTADEVHTALESLAEMVKRYC